MKPDTPGAAMQRARDSFEKLGRLRTTPGRHPGSLDSLAVLGRLMGYDPPWRKRDPRGVLFKHTTPLQIETKLTISIMSEEANTSTRECYCLAPKSREVSYVPQNPVPHRGSGSRLREFAA